MVEGGQARPKALIVEDSPLVAEDLAHHLSDLGYQVCAITASPVEAMKLLNTHQPDLVTLDLNLGGAADGLGVAVVLRATAMFPILFVTGSQSSDIISELESFEASALVRKPFTKDEIVRGIELATGGGTDG